MTFTAVLSSGRVPGRSPVSLRSSFSRGADALASNRSHFIPATCLNDTISWIILIHLLLTTKFTLPPNDLEWIKFAIVSLLPSSLPRDHVYVNNTIEQCERSKEESSHWFRVRMDPDVVRRGLTRKGTSVDNQAGRELVDGWGWKGKGKQAGRSTFRKFIALPP